MMEDMMAMMMMGDLMTMGMDEKDLEKGFSFGAKMPGAGKNKKKKK